MMSKILVTASRRRLSSGWQRWMNMKSCGKFRYTLDQVQTEEYERLDDNIELEQYE